jgi:hypothetical protein
MLFDGINVDHTYNTFEANSFGEFMARVKNDPFVEVMFINVLTYQKELNETVMDFDYYNPLPNLDTLANLAKDMFIIASDEDDMYNVSEADTSAKITIKHINESSTKNPFYNWDSGMGVPYGTLCLVVLKKTQDDAFLTLPYFTRLEGENISYDLETLTVDTLLGYLYSKFGSKTHIYLDPYRVNVISIRSFHDGIELTKTGTTLRASKYRMRDGDTANNNRQFVDKIYLIYKDDNFMWQVVEKHLTTLYGVRDRRASSRSDYRGHGIVQEGQHINAYKLGNHNYDSYHPCLRQARKMKAYRDNQYSNGYYDLVNVGIGNQFGTRGRLASFNIHTCLEGATSGAHRYQQQIQANRTDWEDVVGKYSEGCQTVTVPTYNDWTNFTDYFKKHDQMYKRDDTNIADFTYLLLEEWDIVRYLGENNIAGLEFRNTSGGDTCTFEEYIVQFDNVTVV